MHYLLGIIFVAAVAIWQPAAPTRAELDALGPQVGERVPDFSLVDQAGASRTLQSVAREERADAGVLPFGGLVTLLQDAARAAATQSSRTSRSGALALRRSVTTRRRRCRRSRDARGITFPLLSDQGSATIKAYRLLNDRRRPGIPPAFRTRARSCSIARGVVVSRSFESATRSARRAGSLTLTQQDGAHWRGNDSRRRISCCTLVGQRHRRCAGHAPAPRARRDAKAEDARVFPRPDDLIPSARYRSGRRFSVARSGVSRSQSSYFFKPLNETQLVYSGAFRIRQDVTVAVTPAMRDRAAQPARH